MIYLSRVVAFSTAVIMHCVKHKQTDDGQTNATVDRSAAEWTVSQTVSLYDALFVPVDAHGAAASRGV